MKGRNRKPNHEHQLSGSKNVKSGLIESKDMVNPQNPPEYLTEKAKSVWISTVPNLVDMGVVKEADRNILSVYCRNLARIHDETTTDDGKQLVSEIEKRTLLKTIMEIGSRLGLDPLSRARSGISQKKTSGVKTRP